MSCFGGLLDWILIIVDIVWICLLAVSSPMSLLVDWIGLLILTCNYKHACNELHCDNIRTIVEDKLVEIR